MNNFNNLYNYSSSYLRRTDKLLTRPAKICVGVPTEGTDYRMQNLVGRDNNLSVLIKELEL